MMNRSFDIQQEYQKWKQIVQPFLQTAAQKSQHHDSDMIDLCQNDEQLAFDNAAYMPSLEMLTKVLPVLDIQVWDVEPFTDGTNVVGWTLGFAPEIGCIGMNIEALMKKHLGKTIWFHPPYITSVQTYEEIWPIWKGGTFLKQFFEYAAETRNEDMTKVVLVLPVTAPTIDGKLSYSLDGRLILLMLRKYTQKVVITQGGEVDVADKEAINLLRWVRRHHVSIRALKGCMRTTCTWDHVMAMRKTLTPYLSKGRVLEVATKGGTRTCGVVELHDIVTNMVACAHAEDSIRKYEENTYLAVVICSDATVFHNASSTRCDVFVDLWEDRGAHHHGQAWASWWVFDGGDDVAHLQRMDAVEKLNDQVKKLEAEGGIEMGGTPKKLFCFKSGDGKVMMSGSCGKCWHCNLKYDQLQAHLFAIADFPVLPGMGSLMSCIPPVRNVGDVAHCCARVGTGIGKRLKDSARTWGSPGALRAVSHFISNLRQEAKHIPVAERVMRAPSKEKEHTLDINASDLFFETPALHAELVRIVAMYCTHVVKWEGNR